MTLTHYDLEEPIELSSSKVNVLVFEDAEKFYFYTNQLKEQCDGESGGYSLFEGERSVPFKHLRFFSDYYALTFGDKKLQTALINSVQQIVDGKLLVEFTKLQEEIFNFLDRLNGETDFQIQYNVEAGVQPLLKAYGICWGETGDSLLEKLVSLIVVSVRLLSVKCFVFVNLKSCLSEASIIKLYKEAQLQDVSLLLIENVCRTKLENEYVTVIDKDFCQFVV